MLLFWEHQEISIVNDRTQKGFVYNGNGKLLAKFDLTFLVKIQVCFLVTWTIAVFMIPEPVLGSSVVFCVHVSHLRLGIMVCGRKNNGIGEKESRIEKEKENHMVVDNDMIELNKWRKKKE